MGDEHPKKIPFFFSLFLTLASHCIAPHPRISTLSFRCFAFSISLLRSCLHWLQQKYNRPLYSTSFTLFHYFAPSTFCNEQESTHLHVRKRTSNHSESISPNQRWLLNISWQHLAQLSSALNFISRSRNNSRLDTLIKKTEFSSSSPKKKKKRSKVECCGKSDRRSESFPLRCVLCVSHSSVPISFSFLFFHHHHASTHTHTHTLLPSLPPPSLLR